MNTTKKSKESRSAKTRAPKANSRARQVERPATKPAGPPLAGAELNVSIARVLCEKYRNTPERKAMRKTSRGASDEAIEAALASPEVRQMVQPAATAYVLEQSFVLLLLIYSRSRTLLESDKGSSGQTALKIAAEGSVEGFLELAVEGLKLVKLAVAFSSEFERSVAEGVLRVLRPDASSLAGMIPSPALTQRPNDSPPMTEITLRKEGKNENTAD